MSHAARTANPAPGPQGPLQGPSLLSLVQQYEDFAKGWEQKAKTFEKMQATAPGHVVIREVLAGLRGWVRDVGEAEVNLTTAAQLSGYSVRQLRRMLRTGELKNRGSVGSPRIRLCDLKRK